MAHKYADQVTEVTETSGTGTYTLAGAVAGKLAFSSFMSNGDTTTAACVGADSTGAAAVEWGLYTYSSGTLARTSVLGGSNGTSPVNWLSGVNKVIYCTPLAERMLLLDFAGTGMVGLPTNLTLTGLTGTLTLPGTALATSSTSFSLLNTTATTLNIGGAATTINIGAATGTLTLANATTAVTGALTVGGNTTLGNATSDTVTFTARLASGLTWGNDNTDDIGAIGANRPRDLFLGRNAAIGGTLAVNGNTTLGDASTDTTTINGTAYIGGAAGAEGLRVIPTTSAVNYWQGRGAATGGQPALEVAGANTDITALISSKGGGALNFYSGTFSNLQAQILSTPSANRAVTLTGSNGGAPVLGSSAGPLALVPSSGNLSLLTSAGSFGGGTGTVFIGNATVVPTTNPSGGGVLYVESGAIKWRGPGGTVTTIAAA